MCTLLYKDFVAGQNAPRDHTRKEFLPIQENDDNIYFFEQIFLNKLEKNANDIKNIFEKVSKVVLLTK